MANKSIRGDTIVEVVLSFAIFAVVAVSVSVLMSRGLAIGQQSLEIALVREQISSQAEMIRFARYDASSASAWDKIKDDYLVDGSIAAEKPETCDLPTTGSPFIVHPQGDVVVSSLVDIDNYNSPETSSFVDDSGQTQGLWIQAARAEGSGSVAAYDFYINACWYMPSADSPQTLQTVVRLYDEA